MEENGEEVEMVKKVKKVKKVMKVITLPMPGWLQHSGVTNDTYQ